MKKRNGNGQKKGIGYYIACAILITVLVCVCATLSYFLDPWVGLGTLVATLFGVHRASQSPARQKKRIIMDKPPREATTFRGKILRSENQRASGRQ